MVDNPVNTGVLGHILVGLNRSRVGQKSLGESRLENVLFVSVKMVNRRLDRDLGASRHGRRGVEGAGEDHGHCEL